MFTIALATRAALIGRYLEGINGENIGITNCANLSPKRFSFLLPIKREGRKTEVDSKFKPKTAASIFPFNFR